MPTKINCQSAQMKASTLILLDDLFRCSFGVPVSIRYQRFIESQRYFSINQPEFITLDRISGKG